MSNTDRTELTVNDMTQHIHQHSPEPRDLDYRAQAFQFALGVTSARSAPFGTLRANPVPSSR